MQDKYHNNSYKLILNFKFMPWTQNNGCEYVWCERRSRIKGEKEYTTKYLTLSQYCQFKGLMEKMGLKIRSGEIVYFELPNSERFEIDDFKRRVTSKKDSDKSLRKRLDEICGIKEVCESH